MAPAGSFSTARSHSSRAFQSTRALLAFGIGMSGGLFLGQLGIGLIDGWANVSPAHRLSLGLSVLGAMICLLVGGALLSATGEGWARLGLAKWPAILGAPIFASFLSGALISGEWSWFGVACTAAGVASFVAAVVLALRGDMQRNESETEN